MSNCTVCEETVQVPQDAVIGEVLACEHCEAELELLQVEPVELGLAPELGEDWGE